MTGMSGTLPAWPALDLGGRPLPAEISYERGVWGKVHGAASDFRWIAATPSFMSLHRRFESELQLGSEDAPTAGTLWRTLDGVHCAVAFYPSPARDAAGRSSFLEKQVVEWRRPPEAPAALGALLLLRHAAELDSGVWWARRADVHWAESDFRLELGPAEHPPRPVSPDAVERAVEQGIQELLAAASEEALAELYAALLAGGRALPLSGLTRPLPPEALAALLLPLPRDQADRLSIAGWLPSLRLAESGIADLRQCWDLVLGGSAPLPAADGPAPTSDLREQARLMVRALRERDPGLLSPHAAASGSRATSHAAGTPVPLSMWGPTAAGKTVLLAQLYLKTLPRDGDWEIFPTAKSLRFLEQMRATIRTGNLFPTGTAQKERARVPIPQPPDRRRDDAVAGGAARLPLHPGRHDEARLHDRGSDGPAALRLGSGPALRPPARAGDARERDLAYPGSCPRRRGPGCQGQPADRGLCLQGRRPRAVAGRRAPRPRVSGRVRARARRSDPRAATPGSLLRQHKLFPVSAAGVRLRYGSIEPVVFYDENLTPRLSPGGESFNLMAPFAWLLDQVAAR